jgi:hypothetical protein
MSQFPRPLWGALAREQGQAAGADKASIAQREPTRGGSSLELLGPQAEPVLLLS